MKTNRQSKVARHFGKAVSIFAVALVVSCVTVNVNFPESAVQRAADDFVRDLYKGGTAVADANAKETESDAATMKSSMKKPEKKKPATNVPASAPAKPTSFNFTIFNSAYAIELVTNTPKALELKKKLAGRVPDLSKWKDKGVICETQDGMLKVAAPAKAGADAGKVAALVKSENNDREDLYDELKSANRMGSDAPIRKSFAGAFREKSPPQAKCD